MGASEESSEVRAFALGGVYVAEVGTAFPEDLAEAIGDPWIGMGFLTPEGPRLTFGQDTTDVPAWQSDDPVRILTTAKPKTVAFDVLQTNRHTVELGLGGGTWTDDYTPGVSRFVPADSATILERAVVVEMIDGDLVYRVCYRKGQKMGEVTMSGQRTAASTLALQFRILAPDSGAPFEIFTNDPNASITGAAS